MISEHAVADDLTVGRLVRVDTPGLDLRQALRVVWDGPEPSAGAAGT